MVCYECIQALAGLRVQKKGKGKNRKRKKKKKQRRLIPGKVSLHLGSRWEFTLNHFYTGIFSNFYNCLRFYILIHWAETTVNLLCLVPVIHAEWMNCDGLLCFNNWSKQMNFFTLRLNKRWWMRTSVEQEVRCTFLGHTVMLSNLWEYAEKQARCSMEIYTFPKRGSEALNGA